MATRETQFQAELVKAASDIGAHAFKASHQYLVGVPDLHMTFSDLSVWVECKFVKISEPFRSVTVSMTRHQHAFMQREMNAGGQCAFVVGYVRDRGKPTHGLFLAATSDRKFRINSSMLSEESSLHITKERGKPWDMHAFMRALSEITSANGNHTVEATKETQYVR